MKRKRTENTTAVIIARDIKEMLSGELKALYLKREALYLDIVDPHCPNANGDPWHYVMKEEYRDYYLFYCHKCGTTWRISKKQWNNELQQLNKEIAKFSPATQERKKYALIKKICIAVAIIWAIVGIGLSFLAWGGVL